MKLSLVVAQGVHEGKVIPITVPQFMIGRDPHCQLRPASASISKQHCAVFVKDGKVFIRDFGSTNGTFVNDDQVAGEREVKNNDRVKAGPLEFILRVEQGSSPVLKPLTSKPTAPAAAAKEADEVSAEQKQDPDQLAAMLLGMDDGEQPSASSEQTAEAMIPDGTTVMDLPATPGQAKPDEKKKKGPPGPDTASAAAAILSKYMRRPRT